MIRLVSPTEVDGLWPYVSAGLQRAVDKGSAGDISTGDMWCEARSGRAFLLVDERDRIVGASVWTPRKWGAETVLFCLGMYSEKRDWLPDLRAMVWRIADDCGANALHFSSRRPWLPLLAGERARLVTALYEVRR